MFVELLTSVLAYVIPDVPYGLQKQIRRERNLINHLIVSSVLDQARGRSARDRPAAGFIAGSRDNSQLCTLMSGTGGRA